MSRKAARPDGVAERTSKFAPAIRLKQAATPKTGLPTLEKRRKAMQARIPTMEARENGASSL